MIKANFRARKKKATNLQSRLRLTKKWMMTIMMGGTDSFIKC